MLTAKIVAVPPQAMFSLARVLQEEIETSMERLPGLALVEAKKEAEDIDALFNLLLRSTEDIALADQSAMTAEQSEKTALILERRSQIDLAVHRMRDLISERVEREEPNSVEAIEIKSMKDYHAVAGKVVLLSQVECLNDENSSVTVHCEPPAVARIMRYPTMEAVGTNVRRWTDDDHCDPVYDVEILEPHPVFEDLRPSWVFGTCRATDGSVDLAPVRLADDAMQTTYARVAGLAFDEVAPPRSFVL